MSNFDADVQETTARHQCGNSSMLQWISVVPDDALADEFDGRIWFQFRRTTHPPVLPRPVLAAPVDAPLHFICTHKWCSFVVHQGESFVSVNKTNLRHKKKLKNTFSKHRRQSVVEEALPHLICRSVHRRVRQQLHRELLDFLQESCPSWGILGSDEIRVVEHAQLRQWCTL